MARWVVVRIHDMIGGCCLGGWKCFREGIDGARFGIEMEGQIYISTLSGSVGV